MALNKKSAFELDTQNLASFHKVLSHPARLAILETLAERRSCICGEIVEVLPLAQATVSQHLKELKEAGLISGDIEGKTSCYCIDWEKLNEVEREFQNFFESLKNFKTESDRSCC